MVLTASFWKGRRVFLTGHSGFKGGWLALWLARLGADVTGFALTPPSDPSLFEVAGVASSIRSLVGDIRDAAALSDALAAAQPEIVFHLAAQPIVRRSYVDPVETYSTNVMGTVNLFEAVRRSDPVRVVVNVTSDKCYENPEWHWGCREIDPMGGKDPYSNSKGCAELVTAAYRHSFFANPKQGGGRVALASARAGNVIGGGDWASDRLIPDMVRGMAAGTSTVIRNPASVRPWQHVLEPLSGYLLLAERLFEEPARWVGAWNFGPSAEDCVPVSDVLDVFVSVLDGRARWHVEHRADAPHEARLLYLDISKARSELGWTPRWRLQTAVHRTAEWYKACLESRDMRAFTLAQIAEFEARA